MASLRLPGRALPVLHDVAAAVLGGTLAGVGAALALAGAGHRTLLLAEGFGLGTELTAANRPWLTVPADPAAAGPLRPLLPPGARPGTEVPLRPAEVKVRLEDALLDAGVALLYGVRALGPREGEGLVVVDASGRQLVRCAAVLDATATATEPASAAPRRASRDGAGRAAAPVWSVEFDGAAGTAADLAGHPAADGVAFHDGCRGSGHVHGLFATRDGRYAALRAAGALLRAHPGLRRATLGALGTEPVAPVDPCAALRAGARMASRASFAPRAHRRAAAPPRPAAAPPGAPAAEDGVTVHEQDAPRPGGRYPRQRVAPRDVPLEAPVDVLVVGGGTSGASAALAAAAEGARVVLVERGPGPGGTGTYGGVHSYWFGRREGHAARVRDRTRRVHRALGLRGGVGAWHVEAKALALHDALRAAGVDVRYDTWAFAALRAGDRVTGAVVLGPAPGTPVPGTPVPRTSAARVAGASAASCAAPYALTARVVVDATGEADVAAWAGAPCVHGAAQTHTVMWASLARFETPGTTRNTFGGLADLTDVTDATRAVLAARRRGTGPHDDGDRPVTREGRHLVGQAVLTLTDQLTGRRWPDAVGLHFSNHDLKGKGEALWPQLGLVPPNLLIEVPYRALLPRGLRGLLVTGKALSATHDALPALRMQADLENLGAATGLAAALCARDGADPHDLHVPTLQRRLRETGVLPAADEAADEGDEAERVPSRPLPLPEAVREVTARLPLHAYSDMGRREVFTGRIPFVDLALDADPAVTPRLRAELDAATGPARLVLAQLLVCRGHRAGSDVLHAHLSDVLAGPRLPVRSARIREAQLPPDQSAMPDEVYLLTTLALARERRSVALWERVAELLEVTPDTLRDPVAGTFFWVEAVCAGAERLGHPDAAAPLRRLHARPALHGQWRHQGVEPDDFQERRAMLELSLARALAQCGDPSGAHTLIAYLCDRRAPLAAQAHTRLRALYDLPPGEAPGRDPDAWRRLAASRGTPPARPLPWRHDPHRDDLPPGARVGAHRRAGTELAEVP